MCLMSVVAQQFPQQFPQWDQTLTLPNLIELKEVLRRLDKIDQALEAKNCLDAEKESLLKKLDDRIKQLEDKHNIEVPG